MSDLPGQEEKIVAAASGWTWVQWLMLIVSAIVIGVLIYVLIRIIIRRIQLSRMVGTMREDLLLRRELVAMAAGKDIAAQQKEQYLRTENIRMDVASAVQKMTEHGISPRRTGSWLLLGEPGAGKSRLMESAGIPYPAGLNDFSRAAEVTSTFNLWMTEKGAVWDIGGRTFLSRWGGRQDQEWRVFLTEYGKIYKKALPNGIVLTIPADALLLDPPDLRDRKATLIAEEMRMCSRMIGAYCPVWVVITKCDLVEGFSEYCALLSDKDCEQALGWRNPQADAIFDPAQAESGFDRVVQKLCDLRSAFALNEQVWEKTAAGSNRADIMTPVYLMPERFAGMKESLSRYLTAIFTHIRHKEDKHGLFRFQGFWFVAALDKPVTTIERVTLEKENGKLRPVTRVLDTAQDDDSEQLRDVSDIVSVHEKILSSTSARHYFTKNLMQHSVLGTSGLSRYTPAAVSRMRRPYRIAGLALLLLALPLAIAAYMLSPGLQELAHRDVFYWENIHNLFENGAVGNAPLVEQKEDQQAPLTDEPVPGTQTSRREFLYMMSNMSSLSADLSFFWRPAAWLVDKEPSSTLLKAKKDFINKAAIVNMFLRPVVDTTREVYTYRADNYATLHSPWVEADTRALSTLMQITRYGIRILNKEKVIDDINYTTLVNLKNSPSRDSALKSLWINSVSKNETMSAMTQLNGYLKPVSMEAALALSKAIALYNKAVSTLEIYPDFHYRDMIAFVHRLERMRELHDDMRALEAGFVDAVKRDDRTSMASLIADWEKAYGEAKQLEDQLEKDEDLLDIDKEASLRACVAAVQQKLNHALVNDLQTFGAHSKDLGQTDNAEFLRGQVARLTKVIIGVLPRMATECDALATDKLCRFWDRPEDELDQPHPWQNSMTYADALHELFTFPIPAGSKEESFHYRLARIQERHKQYEARVAAIIKDERNLLDEASWAQNWRILERQALMLCLQDAPQSNLEVPLPGDAPALARKLPALPYTRAGRVAVNPHYAPVKASARVADLQELSAYTHAHLTNDAYNEELDRAVQVLDNACNHYLMDYIFYWTESVPANYKIRGIDTWKQFVESGETLNATDMAAIFYDINEMLIEALSIPSLQNEAKYPALIDRLEEVKAAQKVLDVEMRRDFNNTSDFISKLPTDAAAAWKSMLYMPVEKLFSIYWGSWRPRQMGATFPWWNYYLSCGMNLLKREAAEAEQASITEALSNASKFPLCNTTSRGRSDILSLYDLMEMGEQLDGLEQVVDEKRDEEILKEARAHSIPEEVASLKLPLLLKGGAAWTRLNGVLKLLAAVESPLTCELVLPAVEVRRSPITGEDSLRRVIPAGYRFSYCRVTCGGKALTQRFSMNRQNEQDAAMGSGPLPADAADLQFEFFRHSSSTSPDSVLKVEGAWSALNLYLRAGVRLADDKKTAYVPLVFRDREGYTCLFWLGLRFNREMIPPDEWPTNGIFNTASQDDDEGLAKKEIALRRAFRKVFLTQRNMPVEVSPDDRAALRREIDAIAAGGYKVAFEVVTPDAEECPNEARLQAAAQFPYFSVGGALESSGKLRAVPDVTRMSGFTIPGSDKLLLRLYRHAQEEFSAMYLQQEEPLLDFVLRSAKEYNAIPGYLTVPVTIASDSGYVAYTLYLRPVLSISADDGLLPSGDSFSDIDYPETEDNEQ